MARRQIRHYPLIASPAVKRRMREAAKPVMSQPTRAQRIANGWALWGSIGAGLRNLVLNGVGLVAVAGAVVLLWDAVMKPTIAFAPISVPEELEKKGYTSALVADKLRAAVNRLVSRASSTDIDEEILGPSDIPDIAMPYTGLSVETIAAEIRRIAGRPNRWHVSGGVDAKGKLYELNLKLANDAEPPTDSRPMVDKDIEQLIETSAQNILQTANPLWLVLYNYSVGDLDKGLSIAKDVVRKYPEPEHAASAYNLMGVIHQKQGDVAAAKNDFREAANLQPENTFTHRVAALSVRLLFGVALDKSFAAAHNHLGEILQAQGMVKKAKEQYDQAAELDRDDYALPHQHLAKIHHALNNLEMEKEHRIKAKEIERKHASLRHNLGDAPQERGKRDPAAEEAQQKQAVQKPVKR